MAKSRKAWQTMELYPTWISEVHQTYPGHRKSIWACRECLGHPISKRNKVKRMFSGWDIQRISFLTKNDYSWLQVHWLQNDFKLTTGSLTTSWLQLTANLMIDYNLTTKLTSSCKWLQILTAGDCKLIELQNDFKLTTNDYKNGLTANDYKYWLQLTESSLNYKMTSSWPQMTTKMDWLQI